MTCRKQAEFADAIEGALVKPALLRDRIGRVGAGEGGVLRRERLLPMLAYSVRRLCFLLAWAVTWPALFVVSRLLCLVSREPRFALLRKSGAAEEPDSRRGGC